MDVQMVRGMYEVLQQLYYELTLQVCEFSIHTALASISLIQT